MSPEQKFWLTCWSLVAVSFLVLCTAILTYNLSELMALQSTRDPIALRCALGSGGSVDLACNVVSARKL